MNKLRTLLRIGLKNEFDIFKFNKSSKKQGPIKKILTLLATIYVIIILFFTVGFYAYMLAEPLSKINHTYLIIAIFYIITVIVTFIGGINKTQGVLFTSKDNELLFSMPIKKNDILISRFMQLLIFEYIWTFIIMLPVICIYSYFSKPAFSFYLISLLMILLLPIIPMLLATLIGYLIQLLSSKSKRKNLFRTLFYIIFLGIFMYFSYGFQQYIPKIVEKATSISSFLETIYYPLGVYILCIFKINWLKIIFVLVLNIALFILVINILSIKYFKLLSKLNEQHSKSNYKMKQLKSRSLVKALLFKEIKRFFSSSIYIINTMFGIVLFLLASIYVLYKSEQGLINIFKLASINNIDVILKYIPKAIMIMSAFCISTCAISASSISMEGKTLWILKSLPICIKKIFLSKILTNMILVLPFMILGNILFAIVFKFNIIDIVYSLLFCIIFTIFESLFGLIINLKFPKTNAINDTVIIKQSVSIFLGVFIPMISIILSIAIFLIMNIQRINVYLGIILGIYVILDVVIWYILKRYGIKRLYNIY